MEQGHEPNYAIRNDDLLGVLSSPNVTNGIPARTRPKHVRTAITRIGLGVLAALVLYLAHQAWVWRPYYQFYNGTSYKAALKLAATVALCQPFSESEGLIGKFGGDIILYEPDNAELRRLLARFPPPRDFLDQHLPFPQRITALRRYVAGVLPSQSIMPQAPEPVRALELLGDNPRQAKYPKLCSKLAKIMVQYLSAAGIVSRIVQLEGHIALEVYAQQSGQWQLQDPYFDTEATLRGQPLSAAKAHDRLVNNQPFNYDGPKDVFLTVGFVPRNNFAQDHLPEWHYFNYRNLDYWRVLRVSGQTSDFWKRLHALAPPLR